MCVCVCVCDGEWPGFRFHPIHHFSKEQVLYVFARLKKRATESNRVWRGKSFSVSDKRSRLPHATLRYAVHIFKPCWPAHVLNLCVCVYVCFFFLLQRYLTKFLLLFICYPPCLFASYWEKKLLFLLQKNDLFSGSSNNEVQTAYCA